MVRSLKFKDVGTSFGAQKGEHAMLVVVIRLRMNILALELDVVSIYQ